MTRSRLSDLLALLVWGFASWLLLTWTVQAEQLVCGALTTVAMAALLLPMTDRVVRPWALLEPRRTVATLRLIVVSLVRIARANIGLAVRIWSPRRPLTPGMVVVRQRLPEDAAVAGVGLLSSLIVDNQLVDLDRSRDELQYHAVQVPEPDADRAETVTGGTRSLVLGVLEPAPRPGRAGR